MIKDKMKTWVEEQELQKRELSGNYRSESDSYGNWITNLEKVFVNIRCNWRGVGNLEDTSTDNTQSEASETKESEYRREMC